MGGDKNEITRKIRARVTLGQINSNGYCEIIEDLGTTPTSYCAVIVGNCTTGVGLHVVIEMHLNCLDDLMINKTYYVPGNITYLGDDRMHPWDNNYEPSSTDCLGPAGKLWYSPNGTNQTLNVAQSNAYLDEAYNNYIYTKNKFNTEGYHVWKTSLIGQYSSHQGITASSNCTLLSFSDLAHLQDFWRFKNLNKPKTLNL